MDGVDRIILTLALIVVPGILLVQLWLLDAPRRRLRRPTNDRREHPPEDIDPLSAAILLRLRRPAAGAFVLDLVARRHLGAGLNAEGERVVVTPSAPAGSDPETTPRQAWGSGVTSDLDALWGRRVGFDDRLMLDGHSTRLRTGLRELVGDRYFRLQHARLIHSEGVRRLGMLPVFVVGLFGMLALGATENWWALAFLLVTTTASVLIQHYSAPMPTETGRAVIRELLAWRGWLVENRQRLLASGGTPAELGWLALFGLIADARIPSSPVNAPVGVGEPTLAVLPATAPTAAEGESELLPFDLGEISSLGVDLGSIGVETGGDGGDSGGNDGGGD